MEERLSVTGKHNLPISLSRSRMEETQIVLEAVEKFEDSCQVPVSWWESCEKFLISACLPEQCYGEDRPSEEGDFVNFKQRCVQGLSAVRKILQKLVELKDRFSSKNDNVSFRDELEVSKSFVVRTILLCAEHASENMWTTVESCELSASCVTYLCQLCNHSSLSDLLVGKGAKLFNPYFKLSLLTLRPKLLKETWRRYPAAVAAYQSLVSQVVSPYLSEYISMVLPTTLIIIDDHVVERRRTGLVCLEHVIDNVARTELCQQGLQHVLYRTLEPLLLQNTPEQVEPTIKCLVKLLGKTERGYTRSAPPGRWDRFDDTLRVVLRKMEFEDQLVLRSAYAKSLPPLLSAMGPSVIRWSKPLLAVLDEYLHVTSYDTRKEALLAMKTYLAQSVPRICHNGEIIIYVLLRTLFDISEDMEKRSSEANKSLLRDELSLVEECIKLVIKTATGEEVISIKDELSNFQCSAIFHHVISNVFKEVVISEETDL